MSAENVEQAATNGDEVVVDAPVSQSPALFDRWELEQKLKHVERVLDLARLMQEYPAGGGVSQSHEKRYTIHAGAAQPAPRARPKRQPVMSFVAWSSMAIGTVAFTCGSALCGWGYLTGRDELWNLGVPLAPSGQVGVLAGVLIQLYRLWRRGSAALDALPELQQPYLDDAADQSEDSTSDPSPPLAGPHWHQGPQPGTTPSALDQLAEEMVLAPQLLRELRGGMDRLSRQISRPGRG